MLTNGSHLSFDKMGELLYLPMTVHTDESSMDKILSFADASKIVEVHINMDTSKEKFINIHMQDTHIIYFRVYVEGLFYKNLYEPSIVTNDVNTSVNPYSFISTAKKNSEFFTDCEVERERKVI